jgi:hypothetical protein
LGVLKVSLTKNRVRTPNSEPLISDIAWLKAPSVAVNEGQQAAQKTPTMSGCIAHRSNVARDHPGKDHRGEGQQNDTYN